MACKLKKWDQWMISRAISLSCLILLIVSPSFIVSAEQGKPWWEGYDSRSEPLNVEVVKQWETDKGVFQLVRYDIGAFKGTNKAVKPIMSAFYGYPKGASANTKVPGIVQIHGGGQRAHLPRVEDWVELGFASISINWGGRVLEGCDESTPNTDWKGLAAGFIRPGITEQALTHHNGVYPTPHTLYKEHHPLNSSWNLVTVAAWRALTFLEQRPEVNADQLGVEGHSMGGRLTVLTAVDPRVKAASPSVGGTGFLYDDMWGLPGSARHMRPGENRERYREFVSPSSRWPHIKAKTLFLQATNDFNAPMEWAIKGMKLLPEETERITALAPHFNHRFTNETDSARFMWMVAHLQGEMSFPRQSQAELILTEGAVPLFRVVPDTSSGLEIADVQVYYGYARDPRIRFWRSATTSKEGGAYIAHCHLFDTNEPLFAFANITYKLGRTLPRRHGVPPTDRITVSSAYKIAYPEDLQKADSLVTEKPERLIDDFKQGWRDWYRLNYDNPHHWFYATRKVVDPSWVGPKGGKLAFTAVTDKPGNKLAVGIIVNAWQGYTGRRQQTFHAIVDLPNAGINDVALLASDFKNDEGQPMPDWHEATELFFTPVAKIKGPYASKELWEGSPLVLKDLRWIEGTYGKRPYPHDYKANRTGNDGFKDAFDQAVKDSVEREELDEAVAKDGKVYLAKEMSSRNNSFWRVMNNRAVTDVPISIGGKQYKKGLGVHADSEIAFPINGKYKTFHVVPGPDDAHRGKLQMIIKVDGKTAYDSGVIHSQDGVERKPIEIDISKAKELILIVTAADGDKGGDHADWADAYLVPLE